MHTSKVWRYSKPLLSAVYAPLSHHRTMRQVTGILSCGKCRRRIGLLLRTCPGTTGLGECRMRLYLRRAAHAHRSVIIAIIQHLRPGTQSTRKRGLKAASPLMPFFPKSPWPVIIANGIGYSRPEGHRVPRNKTNTTRSLHT
jgi:hypothetical protein